MPSTTVVSGSMELDQRLHTTLSVIAPSGMSGSTGARPLRMMSRIMPWPIWMRCRIGSSGEYSSFQVRSYPPSASSTDPYPQHEVKLILAASRTWKIGNSTNLGYASSPFWHYKLGLEQGWMPTDPRVAGGYCKSIGVGGDQVGCPSSFYSSCQRKNTITDMNKTTVQRHIPCICHRRCCFTKYSS